MKQMEADWRKAKLDDRTRALLELTEKAALDATKCTKTDLDGLRALGFTDEDILDAVSIMAFFQYANLHCDVLGLELNPEYASMKKVEFKSE